MSQTEAPEFIKELLPGGYVFYMFEELSSTMDKAHQLARAGASHGTIVLAKKQTNGRGRGGKTWISGEGDLTFSLILRPPSLPLEISCLSLMACIAAGHALLPDLHEKHVLEYKWPNDILLNSAKVAGCLLEVERAHNTLEPGWVALGLGMNVQSSPENPDFPATCLLEEDIAFKGQNFLARFCCEIEELLNVLQSKNFGYLANIWQKRCWGKDHPVTIRVSKEKIYEGTPQGIDEKGRLLLLDGCGKVQIITAGSMFSSAAV